MTAITAIEKKSLKVGKYVDTAHVDTVIREYKKTRWVFNSERIGKEDSMSVWYSVEELEQFLQKIKDHGGDGVRLYFGTYSEEFSVVPEYAGRQTIVMVATKNKEFEGGITNKDLYINSEKGATVLAYNLGKICPPSNCPGGGRSDDSGDADDWGGLGVTLVDRGDKGFSIV